MTTSLPQSHHDYSFADYLAIERESEIKHEFDAGEILAMFGGTARHSALAAKIVTALETTRPSGCTVFQSDMRVRICATGRATYPDVSMVRSARIRPRGRRAHDDHEPGAPRRSSFRDDRKG